MNQGRAKRKTREGRPARKCYRGDALVFKTKVMMTMRGEYRLSSLCADVKSIRRNRTGEMMLMLKKKVARKGISCKTLALDEKVEVRALTEEAIRQCKKTGRDY